jgi:hypothetical protein
MRQCSAFPYVTVAKRLACIPKIYLCVPCSLIFQQAADLAAEPCAQIKHEADQLFKAKVGDPNTPFARTSTLSKELECSLNCALKCARSCECAFSRHVVLLRVLSAGRRLSAMTLGLPMASAD